MKVKKKHLVGEIADFPLHIVQAMVDEQVRQGNPADPSVFARYAKANKHHGGFDWCRSKINNHHWSDVIFLKNFDLVPEPEKSENFEVKQEHLSGRIADFPLHVVQAMVDEQVRQGNPANPNVFANHSGADKSQGGFNWKDSKLGKDTWLRVFCIGSFHLVPNPTKSKGHIHAKLMKEYAKDAKISETPWEFWEYRVKSWGNNIGFQPCDKHPAWLTETEYRRKVNV